MSDEKKGISLRRKKTVRPTISAPRQISREPSADSRWDAQTTASGNSNTNDVNAPPRRPRLGGEQTSDLVKRRYSTRFTGGIPTDSSAPPIPDVPALPAQYGSVPKTRDLNPSPERERDRSRGRLKVEARAMQDPNLQAEKYVQSILADASENDIRAYQADLQNMKAHTDSDLQHNVYQNRTQFIKISKEADKLKTEMRTLRTLMSELTGALSHATSAGGAEINAESALSVADRKRANRSSVANLEAMWSTHLQTLWKRVEGSQKYLPAVPGRHIIIESQRWVELNAATWKPRRRVALVLLNDHLLVASEKKRNDQGFSNSKGNRASVYNPQSQTTYIAERCWPLHDVQLTDLSTRESAANGARIKENQTISNAINIRAGNESFTYATNDAAEKGSLIVAFRKAQEDLRKQLAAEHGERERALDEYTMGGGRDPRSLRNATAAGNDNAADDGGGGSLIRSGSILTDAEGRPQSVRWVETQIDGLDIDIALQRYEEAVYGVETLRKMAKGIRGNMTAQEIILVKVNERASRLANSVARQLRQRSGGIERTKQNVDWLLRLGFEELARATYLSSRTDTIRARTRQLTFTGALEPYVHALAYTTFTLLLHTFRTFNQAFPFTSSSAVVRWAKESIDDFNATMERQLSNVERRSEVYNACIAVVKQQAATLAEVGVDFKDIVVQDLANELPTVV